MPKFPLPLSIVQSVKLTLADDELLRLCARDLQLSKAEIVRLAIRRFAVFNVGSLLRMDTVIRCREEAAGLPLGPPCREAIELPSGTLAEALALPAGLPCALPARDGEPSCTDPAA